MGTDVTIYTGKENIVKFYNKNLDKYDGVGIDLQQGLYATTRFDNIHMSQMNLGFAELALVVNPNRRQLLEKINKALYNLEENNVILSKCDKYFKEYVIIYANSERYLLNNQVRISVVKSLNTHYKSEKYRHIIYKFIIILERNKT